MRYQALNKYHNKKITTKEGEFDSQKEYTEWCRLKLLEKAGNIRNLHRQFVFELQPSFKANGVTIRAIKYIADFFYFDEVIGKWVAQDTKGFKTDVYELKKKMFLYNFPDIVFFESGKKKLYYRK